MSITAQALLDRIDAGNEVVVVDVRSRREFEAGHVPGAIHFPFYAVLRWREHIPASETDLVVVYCAHGPRAWIAREVLRRTGFRQVIHLEGHMTGWRKAGLREEPGS